MFEQKEQLNNLLNSQQKKKIETFYSFISFFNPQQYPQTNHKCFGSRFRIYLGGCVCVAIHDLSRD